MLQRAETSLCEYVSCYSKYLPKLEDAKDVYQFFKESVRIAWKMAIQRSPMVFSARGIGQKWTQQSNLELIWGSNPNSPNAVIQYFKGPTLFHARNVMVKGTVFVHSDKNPK